MARVITFSTKFPAYHPKAGQPTYFVEKILAGLLKMETKGIADAIYESGKWLSYNDVDSFLEVVESQKPKYHTIRSGHRFKAGDYFSPRIWSGKPYNSKQIIIAPDIKIEKAWSIQATRHQGIFINGNYLRNPTELSQNDGLSVMELYDWLQLSKTQFIGQIICWNKSIEY